MINNFNISTVFIKDLLIIEPKLYMDHRGFFMESYNKKAFDELGLYMDFVQDNHSRSKKGVLRGIHFQTKEQQGKLVRVLKGKVFDVAVDLRKDSQTFGQWYGIELSADNKKMFYIPEGFGHGFLTLEDDTEFLYKTTNYYYPQYDAGLIYDDPVIGIQWPRLDRKYILSDKDLKLPLLEQLEISM